MSVYTKTGDKGTTSLYTGQRVAKNSLRVKAYGTVDEVSSALGLARAFCQNQQVKEICLNLQKTNMQLMTDLASVGQETIVNEDMITNLERIIDDIDAKLPPMTSFLLAGESQGGAFLDLARTVCRRAERILWDLLANELVSDTDIRYLNRLSDLCFMLMRLEENR